MATASSYSNEMTAITGNAGGNVQVLQPVTLTGSRKRNFVATIPLTGQASGSIIGIARLPRGAMITSIVLVTDTSLGSATISIGDVNNPVLFAPAMTLTTVQSRALVGLVAQMGVMLNGPNYDSVTGLVSQAYEDMVVTTGAAALPVSGTLKIFVDYAID